MRAQSAIDRLRRASARPRSGPAQPVTQPVPGGNARDQAGGNVDQVSLAGLESARSSSRADVKPGRQDRKSTRLNSSHSQISYAVFCLKKKKKKTTHSTRTGRIMTRSN